MIPFFFFFSFFFPFTGVETSCADLLKIFFFFFLKTHLSVSTGRELLFYISIPSVEAYSLCTNSVVPRNIPLRYCKGPRSVCVLSPRRVKQSLLLPITSSVSCSNERQRAMWLLMEVKTRVHSIIYLAIETLFYLRQVTFSPCTPFTHVQNGNA